MHYPNDIEDVCYKPEHIEKVLDEIRNNFDDYFEQYLLTEAGSKISAEEIQEFQSEFGIDGKTHKKPLDVAERYKDIIREAISNFERDRKRYLELLNPDFLDEHVDDPPNFKNSTLKNDCPIIRMAIQNKKAKELDKYRAEFKRADPNKLLDVITNLSNFAHDYANNVYKTDEYDNHTKIEELKLSLLDTDDYIAYGVIGGGIKSHILFKFNPEIFPNRGRDDIWALWYLTDKEDFHCEQDSEFIMINLHKNTTQQNFFYPYELFAFYAFQVYRILKGKADQMGVYLDPAYRYVYVNSFLTYVAKTHEEEIAYLKSEFTEEGYDFH